MKTDDHSWRTCGISICLIASALTLANSGFAANSAVVPVGRTNANWLLRHEVMNQRTRQGNVDLIYVGDSIVQHFDNQGKEVWQQYYAGRNALNLGISGDRTEHVLWRLEHGNIEGIKPKLAIVMIGQNNGGINTAEEIAEGVIAIVQKLRAKLPHTKILLLGIFQRREQPTPERAVLAQANEIASHIAAGLPARWDVAQTEMYDEPFHVPPPDAVVFEERWDKGEHFRSGCLWQIGKGRVFYFRPGHETYPVYRQAEPVRVIENAVRWLGQGANEITVDAQYI